MNADQAAFIRKQIKWLRPVKDDTRRLHSCISPSSLSFKRDRIAAVLDSHKLPLSKNDRRAQAF